LVKVQPIGELNLNSDPYNLIRHSIPFLLRLTKESGLPQKIEEKEKIGKLQSMFFSLLCYSRWRRAVCLHQKNRRKKSTQENTISKSASFRIKTKFEPPSNPL